MTLAFLKPYKPDPVSVKAMLHNALAKVEEARPHFPLRASMLMKATQEFCPREHALLDLKQGAQKGSFIGTSQRLTFDHGRDTEERIRNLYLRDKVVGRWRCGVCQYETKIFSKEPKVKCPECGWGHLWNYVEPHFEDPYTAINGHFDLLLDVSRPKLHITELKTINPDDFKTLVAPLAEHRFRTTLYLHLAAQSPALASSQIDTEESTILYASKAFGIKDTTLKAIGVKADAPFSPFKEYKVLPNQPLIQTSLSKARLLKVWRDDKTIGLPAGICPSGVTKRAQSCSVCQACWSGKFPPTLTWLENDSPRHPGKKVVS